MLKTDALPGDSKISSEWTTWYRFTVRKLSVDAILSKEMHWLITTLWGGESAPVSVCQRVKSCMPEVLNRVGASWADEWSKKFLKAIWPIFGTKKWRIVSRRRTIQWLILSALILLMSFWWLACWQVYIGMCRWAAIDVECMDYDFDCGLSL